MTPLEARVHNLEVALMTTASIAAELMPPESGATAHKVLALWLHAGKSLGTFNDSTFVVPDSQLELDLGDPS